MLDVNAIEAVARGESAMWPNWKGDALAMVAEIRRLRKLCGDSERKLDDAYCEPNWSGVEAVMHDLRAASKGEL